jgi:V8-like Glu-specific endopeptidase
MLMEFSSNSRDKSIKMFKKSILFHLLSTYPGFSGSPIMYEDSVIAIHKGGKTRNNSKLGE